MRQVVVDASVVFAALLKQGATRDVLRDSTDLSFAVPEFVFEELERHISRIADIARTDEMSVRRLLGEIMARVRIVPPSAYASFLAQAQKATLEANAAGDEEYVALALSLDAPVWTFDKEFGRIKGVRTVTTGELAS